MVHSVAIINDTGGRGHHGCNLVMSELRRGLSEAGLAEAWALPGGTDWRERVDELRRRPVDVLVVNAEGSVHHSDTRKIAVYLPEIGAFARDELGATPFMVNGTITQINDHAARALRDFRGIYVRQSGSQQELASHGLDSKVVLDLTLGADLPAATERSGVAVTDNTRHDIAAQLRGLAKRNGWPFRTMRENIPKWKWSNPRTWIPRSLDPRPFHEFLSSHELVVTGRFHTVTMCLVTRTPFVAVESNTPKISWLLDDVFGDRRRIVAPNALADLNLGDFNSWSESELRAIDAAVQRARQGATEMFATIAAAAADKANEQLLASP